MSSREAKKWVLHYALRHDGNLGITDISAKRKVVFMKFKKVLAILLATIAIIEGLVLPIPTCVRAAVDYWVDVTANQVYLHKEPYADSERVVPVCKGDVLHLVDSSENK